jgi:simple sugar transport system ATP-binding protein
VTDAAPPLALDRVTKRFGAVEALRDASLVLRAGTVHALLGENGAGKTTLMRIAFGMLRADAGRVVIDGEPRTLRSSADAIALGVGMVHQHFSLVGALTVAENVVLGGRGTFDARSAAERVERLARTTGLVVDPRANVDALPVGAQQRVEILKALARDARVLILDEPTAVLAPAEARELLAWARAFAADGGSVVLITHKLRDALDVADDVTVLRRGAVALARPAAELSADDLLAAMIGAEPPAASGTGVRASAVDAPIVLATRGASVVDARGVTRLADATFEARGGEIVGVAAVEGAGQRELLRLLAGRLAPSTGEVTRPERVGFIPEDRHRDALVLGLPLVENVALRGAGSRRGRIAWGQLESRTRELIERFDVVAPGPRTMAGALSGGNQQKLVLARELDGDPEAVVAENPTRGLDVRAAAAVLARLREARDRGAAVVVHSSDLDEVLAIADRVVVVHAGRVREAPHDRDAVGRLMLGGA